MHTGIVINEVGGCFVLREEGLREILCYGMQNLLQSGSRGSVGMLPQENFNFYVLLYIYIYILCFASHLTVLLKFELTNEKRE